jgi:AraC family transcriptional regulator
LERFHKSPFWVKSLKELLNDCWNENPNLQDLATVLQINPITISKHFPKYFGCTLGEYMRRIKINRSLPLIQSEKKTLTEIGLECGFADQSHFIRTFKNQTGFLPKQFQKL